MFLHQSSYRRRHHGGSVLRPPPARSTEKESPLETTARSARPDRHSDLHPLYHLSSPRPPVGRHNIQLVQRTHHRPPHFIRPPLPNLHIRSTMATRESHNPTTHSQNPICDRRRDLRLLLRRWNDDDRLLPAHLVPSHQRSVRGPFRNHESSR